MKVLIFFITVFALHGVSAHNKESNILDALAKKQVRVRISSLGGYTGYCVNLDLENTGKDSLVIVIEAGVRLVASESKYQDILLVKETRVPLSGRGKKTVQLKGYCCQLNDLAPPQNMAFTIAGRVEGELATLAAFLNANNFGESAEQDAIWSVSDKRPTGSIASAEDTIHQQLIAFVAALKNEPVPWYSFVSVRQVSRHGLIQVAVSDVKGSVKYDLDNTAYGSIQLIDESGMPVVMVKEQWLKPGEDCELDLAFSAKGLKSGRYSVVLKAGHAVLAEKVLEI